MKFGKKSFNICGKFKKKYIYYFNISEVLKSL